MGSEAQNWESARASATFYDRFWLLAGSDIHPMEKIRGSFVRDAIQRHVSSSPAPLKVLDYGCGRGWMSVFLSGFGQVTGVDFSEEGIGAARAHFGKFGSFEVIAGQEERWVQNHLGTFDVVVSSEVIEHVPDAHRFLSIVHSLLVPGGVLVLTSPNGNVFEEYCRIPECRAALQPVENWLKPQQLRDLVQGVGFDVLEHAGQPDDRFRFGSFWQENRLNQLFQGFLGRQNELGRSLLERSLYQFLVCRKPGSPA